MNSTNRKIKARQAWINIYKQLGSISKAARRCGIHRSTLYRWIKRYEAEGIDGLKDKSQKPKRLAKQKINTNLEELILKIRNENKFGPQRISTHLLRENKIEVSAPTVWRILNKQQVKPLRRYRGKKEVKRYSRPIPGDRVQIDVTKIRAKCYQFTAIDDCTRLRVLRLYTNKKADSAVHFLFEVLDAFPFPIQRIQTDWGTEFFNDYFQEELMDHYIKFRPIKPRTPHLNGKIERSQKTDKAEFYSLLNLRDDNLDLDKLLSEWEYFYNHKRPHASLNGKTPYEKYLEVEAKIPFQIDVTQAYWESPPAEIVPRNSKWLAWVEEHKNSSLLLDRESCG
jgi:transposase InsO family protein